MTSSSSVTKKAKKHHDVWESLLEEHKNATHLFKDQLLNKQNAKSASHVFLESFATRMEALEPNIQGIVRIQIAQVFHNAENVGRQPPIPLTPFQSQLDDGQYQQYRQYQYSQFP